MKRYIVNIVILFSFICQFPIQEVFAFGSKPLPYNQISARRAELIDEGSGLIPDLAKMVEAYLFNPYVFVSTGGAHTCALKEDGILSCWGWNPYGQTTVPPGVYTQVSADGTHACGLSSDGSLSCWGKNDDGQTQVPLSIF